jgi:hypothetical protein
MTQTDVRSINLPERQLIMWQDDAVFTKNPDLVELPDGKILCVFNGCDYHWPTEFAKITLIESNDRGQTWGNARVVAASYPTQGDETWVTPRLSRLRDGRLVINCDQNDYRHAHEEQTSGIYTWWSSDDGATWDGPCPTGIPGIEPDHIVELDDGTLLMGTHFMRGDTQKLTEAVARSTDGGVSWGELAIIASDNVHEYCEGTILPLASGRLVCIMRENNHINYPSYLSFSDDGGHSWSNPVEAPFSGDRPFARQLADGRTLVTFRNQAGKPGLYGWLGDIEAEAGYKVTRATTGISHKTIMGDTMTETGIIERHSAGVTLHDDHLAIEASGGRVNRYMLLPPESHKSRVLFEATLQVEGEDGIAAGVMQIANVGFMLTLFPDKLVLSGPALKAGTRAVDLRQKRTLRVSVNRGINEVSVDGEVLLSRLVHHQGIWDRSYFGNSPEQTGTVRWFEVRYSALNPTEPAHSWYWNAASGTYPNQYEIDRWLEIDYNSNPRPDHGYSSWLQFDNGDIFVADYSNKTAAPGKAMLKGYWMTVRDFETAR